MRVHEELAYALASMLVDKGLIDPEHYTYAELEMLMVKFLRNFPTAVPGKN